MIASLDFHDNSLMVSDEMSNAHLQFFSKQFSADYLGEFTAPANSAVRSGLKIAVMYLVDGATSPIALFTQIAGSFVKTHSINQRSSILIPLTSFGFKISRSSWCVVLRNFLKTERAIINYILLEGLYNKFIKTSLNNYNILNLKSILLSVQLYLELLLVVLSIRL